MARTYISRADYLFALGTALVPGAIAVVALYVADVLSIKAALGIGVLVVIAAALVALPWARDAAALRERVANSGVASSGGDQAADAFAHRSPLGSALLRQLGENRRRSEAELRSLEARALDAERVIDALPEPLLVLDDRRRIVHGNLGAEDLFGPGLAGRDLAEIIRSPQVLEAVEQVTASRTMVAIEFDLLKPVERKLEARIAPLPRFGSGGEALLLTLQDLTAIRRAEQMRVDFVANVSHELRTPLTSVAGFVETMQTVARDDAVARDRFLAIMSSETQRMNRLVDDLLSLSRIEMEEHTLPADVVSLADVVDSVVDLLAPLAAEYGATITLDIPDDLPSVTGDADQLGQVVRNLVENAVKYGLPGGAVSIIAAVKDQHVLLSVTDQGEGIPRELHHRLTERFYRVEKARSRRVGGTGLGLAIVKHIVSRHRGRLQIDSAAGKGSTFSVLLPQKR
ncbi:MAG: ATP-binding protein [Alphaproteobacteria bacterium]